MASSSYFFQNSDDEENPFINRDNTKQPSKSRNSLAINNTINTINNNNKNKRYIPNVDDNEFESTLIQESDDPNDYYDANNRKRLKVNNNQNNNRDLINDNITNNNTSPTKNKGRNPNNSRNRLDGEASSHPINKIGNNNTKISITHSPTQLDHSTAETIVLGDITNDNTTETDADSYLNTPSKQPTQRNSNKRGPKNNGVIEKENGQSEGQGKITEKTGKAKNKNVIEVEEEIIIDDSSQERTHPKKIDSSVEEVPGTPSQKKPIQSIRSMKLEMALDRTITKINRLVSYKRFRQCFPTLCSNNREDMKDVHSQMALYFTEALKDEFQIIFKKFEMDKNLLLIDECCRQGKKVSPNDTPNKAVNVIYNRVGPDTIIRSNSVNIKKKQLEELKAYYNELCKDKALDEWIALNNEKEKYKESIEEYITYLSKNIEIMKKNDDY